MDWLQCPAIEQVPGRVSGAPVIRHLRVRPEDLLNNLDLSEAELAASFDLKREVVRGVLDYYWRHQTQFARYL